MDKGFYFHAAQDPSVVVPDTVGVILERLGFAVAKNLGHNSLEDDERGFDICRNFVGATIGRPLLFCGIFREAKRLPYSVENYFVVGEGFPLPFSRQTNFDL